MADLPTGTGMGQPPKLAGFPSSAGESSRFPERANHPDFTV